MAGHCRIFGLRGGTLGLRQQRLSDSHVGIPGKVASWDGAGG